MEDYFISPKNKVDMKSDHDFSGVKSSNNYLRIPISKNRQRINSRVEKSLSPMIDKNRFPSISKRSEKADDFNEGGMINEEDHKKNFTSNMKYFHSTAAKPKLLKNLNNTP